MKPTIRDVAKLANVSISTVSRVMNAPDTVVEEKRIRVQQAILALNYQPNALARGLISKKSNTFGVLLPDIKNTYYNGVLRGMGDAAKDHGYSLMICNTYRDKESIVGYFEMFYEKQIDGVIFMSDRIYPDYYEIIQRLDMKLVLASTHSLEYDIPSVKVNDEQASFDAVDYLAKLGHRGIGMISFPLADPIAGLTRYNGFLRAMRAHGLAYGEPAVEFTEDSIWFEDGYEAAERLFAKHPELTAVFAASDELALGAISYLQDAGVPVPGRVSVVGFDNLRLSGMSSPRLTTVAQPVYDIGYRAVRKLWEVTYEGATSPLREYLPHELVVRQSAAPWQP